MHDETRDELNAWVNENVPAGSKIAVSSYLAYFDDANALKLNTTRSSQYIVYQLNATKVRSSDADYVIIAELAYVGQHLDFPSEVFENNVLKDYEEVAYFENDYLLKDLWGYLDLQLKADFISPDIYVFKRIN